MKCLSPVVFLYPYKPVTWPSMEYCCHVWTGAHSCYLEILDKLQNHLLPLSLSLLNPRLIVRYSSELAQMAPLHFS